MINARLIAGAGVLTVGWGLGAATVASPGIAWADSDFQISIDGQDLFPTAGNSALAFSGPGDIAIAFGDNSYADAEGGTGDVAEAIGTNTVAGAGGSGSVGASNFDTAIDIGDNNSSGYGAFAMYGSDDSAVVNAPDGYAISGGDSFDPSVTGSNDSALVLDPFGAGNDYAYAGATDPYPGNFDLAAILFSDNANDGLATGGNYLFDIWSPLGDNAGAAAATEIATLWTDFLSLF